MIELLLSKTETAQNLRNVNKIGPNIWKTIKLEMQIPNIKRKVAKAIVSHPLQ